MDVAAAAHSGTENGSQMRPVKPAGTLRWRVAFTVLVAAVAVAAVAWAVPAAGARTVAKPAWWAFKAVH